MNLKSYKFSDLAQKSLTMFMKKQLDKTGLPAGSPVFTGEPVESPGRIKTINYTNHSYDEFSPDNISDAISGSQGVNWILLDGVHDLDKVSEICSKFGIHSLVHEDVLNIVHRPKIEEYDDYLFMILKIPEKEKNGTFNTKQLAILMKKNTILTLTEAGGDIFLRLRERIRDSKSRIRKKGADYCLFAILDYIVDLYYPVLHEISGEITDLQQEAMKEPGQEFILRIHEYKTEIMLLLRQIIWPVREICSDISSGKISLIDEDNLIFFRDVNDHIIHLMEVAESLHEILSDMLNVYLSLKSNAMNEVMKVLTIIATIFIPLTFLAGIYGMNFKYMPELEYRYGYFILLGGMFLVFLLMLLYFRKKKWL